MEFSGKWLLKLFPYSVLLVRQWIQVLASVYGDTWKKFTHFLRGGGLWILRTTLVVFMPVWMAF